MPALLGKGSIRLGQRHFQNDVYSKAGSLQCAGSADITVDLTFPATQKHIDKNEVQEVFMVQETPELYKAVVLPHIESFPASRLQWVYNILEKMAEVERLLFEDPDPATGFMLHPDLKWDQAQVTGLYCVAICHRRDVRSLRDLRAEHLPLLLNIRQKGAQVILNRFQVPDDRLRIYLHYQPSYYHLHVHFAHLQLDLGGGAAVGKAYLLDDVIGESLCAARQLWPCAQLAVGLGSASCCLALPASIVQTQLC
eukprot:jgi/Astpho2/4472/e_gw1.00067.224.1_t